MSWYKKSKSNYDIMQVFSQNADIQPCHVFNNWENTNSSFITEIAYDDASRTLAIRMKNGKEYHYTDVEPEMYTRFLAAGSKGIFFSGNVKDNYKFHILRR